MNLRELWAFECLANLYWHAFTFSVAFFVRHDDGHVVRPRRGLVGNIGLHRINAVFCNVVTVSAVIICLQYTVFRIVELY